MLIVLSLCRRRLIAVLGLVFATMAAAADPGLLPGADAKWRHLRSEHFELYSRNGETESRRLLHNLELAHAIFFETYGFKAVRPLPITVYFFSRDRHFETYKPAALRPLEDLATFYHPEPDRGILTVAPLPTYEAAQQTAFGAYTHHLLRVMDVVPPAWYRYGVAGLFKNLVIETKTFELGQPDGPQVLHLQKATLLPVEVMFGADHESSTFQSDDGNRLFQSQSWALLHYLYFGSHKLSRESITGFVSRTLQGGRKYDAEETRREFEQALGLTYGELNAALNRYLRSGRYGYTRLPLPAVPAAKSYAMRSVPLAEINLRLAELAMRVGRSGLGKLTLLHAVNDPAERARIQEALGSDAVKDGDWDQAAERWQWAVEAGSENPAVIHELITFANRRRFARFDLYYRLPDDDAARLRQLIAKSIAAAPQQTTAYEVLAWVEATANAPEVRNVNLIQTHFARLKEQPRTLLALAVVRLRLGDKAGAAGLLDALGPHAADPWIAHGIEHTRAMIEDRPVDWSRLPKAESRAVPGTEPRRISLPRN